MFRFRAPRWLRVLLVIGLVPVVLFANAQTAHAASSGTSTFRFDLGIADPSVNCSVPWALNAGGMVVGSSSRCDGGPDYSPGYCQHFEGACGSYGLVLKDISGTTCGSAGMSPFSDSSNDVGSISARLGGAYIAFDRLGCAAAALCLSYYHDPAGPTPPFDEEVCSSVQLDQPEAPPVPSSCVDGTPSGVRTVLDGPRLKAGSTTIYEFRWYIHLTFSSGPDTNYLNWRVTQDSGPPGKGSNPTAIGTSASASELVFPQVLQTSAYPPGSAQSLAEIETARPKTVEAYFQNSFNTFESGWDSSSAIIPSSYPPPLPNGGYRGLTQPEYCRFYFGAKLVSFAGTEQDEPWGPVKTPNDPTPTPTPTPTPPVVIDPPDDTQPDTDLGLLGAILRVLRLIGSGIVNIAKAVGNLVLDLLDGIKDLFVPNPNYLENRFDDVKTAFDNSMPGQLVTGLDGLTNTGSVSGCSGLPLDLSLPGNVDVHQNIGAACTGKMAEVAGIVRVVISAGLIVGATFASIRAVGSGLGWNPGVGQDAGR